MATLRKRNLCDDGANAPLGRLEMHGKMGALGARRVRHLKSDIAALAEVRDHCLWIKHIGGDDQLTTHLLSLAPGQSIRLKVAEIEGEWRKMAAGPGGTSTPGLRPIGPAKAHWHQLQTLRGTRVPIALALDSPADTQPVPTAVSNEVGAPRPTVRIPLPEPVAKIYEAVEALEASYPGRKFTPDGHLVGSIGEVIAAQAFGLKLYPASFPGHDAVDPAGRAVQIKLTSTRSVSLYATCERLIVLQIISPAEAEVVFDGDGNAAWLLAGPIQKNGQRVVSLAKLHRLALAEAGVQRPATSDGAYARRQQIAAIEGAGHASPSYPPTSRQERGA